MGAALEEHAEQRHAHRTRLAEALGRRLDPLMTSLGVIFFLLLLGQGLTPPDDPLSTVFTIVLWSLWAVFLIEFVTRMVIAPSSGEFLARNWWQIMFLILPLLRVIRLIETRRLAKTGGLMGWAARAGRTAGNVLGTRVGWLASVTTITVLACGQILYRFEDIPRYTSALHSAALTVITGEPFGARSGLGKTVELVLGLYSVVVFAALAGILGAYFLERRIGPRTEE